MIGFLQTVSSVMANVCLLFFLISMFTKETRYEFAVWGIVNMLNVILLKMI